MSAITQLRPASELLMTKQQLASHLGRSTRWVELRVREGMPSEAPTRRFPQRRFRLEAVEGWLANGEPKPVTPYLERVRLLEERVARLAAVVERLEEKIG